MTLDAITDFIIIPVCIAIISLAIARVMFSKPVEPRIIDEDDEGFDCDPDFEDRVK